ncbi:MAG: Dabb family protein [Deltaproteobacteria bacterium]|nr:Dabb family protein [Deltaproteobacteria bacterium]
MIRHIVRWELQAEALGKSKLANAQEMANRLLALRSTVPSIRELHIHFPPEVPEGFDLELDSLFDSWAGLEAYMEHPAHQQVVAFVKQVVARREVDDFEE